MTSKLFSMFKKKPHATEAVSGMDSMDVSIFEVEHDVAVEDKPEIDANESTDPIMDCFVFAHYGRFDLCTQRLSLDKSKNPYIEQLNVWLSNNPTLETWNPNWFDNISNSNPIKEADILVRNNRLNDALEVLETALLEGKGDVPSVRLALSLVSKALCNPKYKLGSLIN